MSGPEAEHPEQLEQLLHGPRQQRVAGLHLGDAGLGHARRGLAAGRSARPAPAASPTPGAAAPCAMGARKLESCKSPHALRQLGSAGQKSSSGAEAGSRAYLQEAEQAAARARREAARKQVRFERRRGLEGICAVRQAAEAGAARAPAQDRPCCVVLLFVLLFVGARGARACHHTARDLHTLMMHPPSMLSMRSS